jgi:hypothetical protein
MAVSGAFFVLISASREKWRILEKIREKRRILENVRECWRTAF